MKKNYFFSAALLLGAAALLSPVQADAKGGWRNVNHLLKNVSQVDGWSGMLTGSGWGVGEFYPGAGMVYQVVRDLPAGEYTLSANAFYRNGNPAYAAQLHIDGKETKNAFVFINDTEGAVPSLFDKAGVTADALIKGGEYQWGLVPNGLEEAFNDFAAGNYTCSVTAQHPGGDMVIGFKYLGNNEGQLVQDTWRPDEEGGTLPGDNDGEWCAFSNFKLVGPNGNVTLAADGIFPDCDRDGGWDVTNVDNGNKGRGLQNGCVFSKTNASVYNHSQTLKDMPAGKYRVAVQSFNQHFLGAHPGYFIPMKGAFIMVEGRSAYDRYMDSDALYPQGAVRESGEVSDPVLPVEILEAYLYINEGEKQNIGTLDPNTKLNVWLEPWTDENGVYHEAPYANEVKIKNLFDEKLDEYPEVQNYKMANGEWKWVLSSDRTTPGWFESGHMREVAAFFVANPDLYQNYAELEFSGDNNTITVGYHKDINQNNYANPVFNFRLEYFDPEYEGYDVTGGNAVEAIEGVSNGVVEYFNLQGVRVSNPDKGVYIVREGNRVVKRVIR